MFMLLIELLFSQWFERCRHICQLELQWWDHIGIELFQGWWMQCLRVDIDWRTWSIWDYLVQVQTSQCLWMCLCLRLHDQSQGLKENVLYLRLFIIIRSKVYICQSSDAKNLCNVVWIDGELFSTYPTLQLNSGISSIWIEFLNSFINRVLKVPKQISLIFSFKYPRNKCSSQGVKFDHSFHHSRSFLKNARVCLRIKRSPESFIVWVSRRTTSPFWNGRWWNINCNLFSSREMARHLPKNIHTTKNEM